MKLNEQDLQRKIGIKEYGILRKIFPPSFLQTDDDMTIPFMGKKRNITMELSPMQKKGFVLSSPTNHCIFSPLGNTSYFSSKSTISVGIAKQENSISISTPDYRVGITDEVISIDGLRLEKKQENLSIDYSSPIIYGLDENYRVEFHIRVKEENLEFLRFTIYSLAPMKSSKKEKYGVISSTVLTETNIHFNSISAGERKEKFDSLLAKIEILYHQRIQTKESDFFDESMHLMQKMLKLKEQDKEWNEYQRVFQERLPELYKIVREWLTQIVQSMESDFHLEEKEIQRLIKARTSMESKISGEEK